MIFASLFGPEFWADFWSQFQTIVTDGGWLMIPITFLSLGIYWTAFSLFAYFWQHNWYRTKRVVLERCWDNPESLGAELRSIVEYVKPKEDDSTLEIRSRFTEVNNAYISQLDSRQHLLIVLITSAPLMGLLGTVMGMLVTFEGIAMGSGASTVDQIAAGISEALITTQTGLIIAIPGYVMASMIRKRRDQMENSLTTLEALCMQRFEKRQKDAA